MKYIGVDIGGTTIKAGVVDEEGKVLSKKVIDTAKTAEEVIKDMGAQLIELMAENNLTVDDITGIGIGCPGSISSDTGIVEYSNNLGWNNVHLTEELKKYVNTDIKISNDANVAALGEAVFGAAKGYNNVIMFTLGTGVGGGIIIDKKLYEGGGSKGAEIGHAVIVLDGEQCTCGRKGCLEAYTSATALIRQTKAAMEKYKDSMMWDYVNGDINKVSGRTSFECAKKGDKAANEVIDQFIKYLGESVLNMCNIFRPDVVIIGGGLSAQKEYLIDKLDKYCADRFYGFKGTPSVKIMCATLGNDAGIIGAAALVK